MILSLQVVKLNNDYDYFVDRAPTPADCAPAYAQGETWLDVDSGYSYELTDEVLGVWVRIEEAIDQKIDVLGDPLVMMVMKYLNNSFAVERNGRDYSETFPNGLPGLSKRDLFNVLTYECIYSKFRFRSENNANTIQVVENSYGWDVEAFKVGDMVLIQGSRRNNLVYMIEGVDYDNGVIAVDGELREDECRATIYLLSFPIPFLRVCGQMLWYDLFKRPQLTGMKSEHIGTYSYTLADMGAMNYPLDIISPLDAFAQIAHGGVSFNVD